MVKKGLSGVAQSLLLPINPTGIIILGVYGIVWGLWIANPFWSVFESSGVYGILAGAAPEVFWGLLAMACGLVTSYGAVKRSYGPLILGSIVSGWHWFMISVLFFCAAPMTTAGLSALLPSVYSLFVWLNLRVNFSEYKGEKERNV